MDNYGNRRGRRGERSGRERGYPARQPQWNPQWDVYGQSAEAGRDSGRTGQDELDGEAGYGPEGYGSQGGYGQGGYGSQGYQGEGYGREGYGAESRGWQTQGGYGGAYGPGEFGSPGSTGQGYQGQGGAGGAYGRREYGGQGHHGQRSGREGYGAESRGWQTQGGYGGSYGRREYSAQAEVGAPGYGGPTGWSYSEVWLIPGPHTGQGPKDYQRSDERIREEVCERLTQHGQVDASDMEVQVSNGEVTLSGTVDSRQAKRMAEEAVESVAGVREVHNNLRLQHGPSSGQGGPSQAGTTQRAGTSSRE